MARKGLHAYTVTEAKNFSAFNEWNFEIIATGGAPAGGDGSGAITGGDSTYVTSSDPAKKIVLFVTPVQASGTGSIALDSGDILYIQLNGETAGKKTIQIDIGDLPFTVTGLPITDLQIGNSDDDAHESVSVISYH